MTGRRGQGGALISKAARIICFLFSCFYRLWGERVKTTGAKWNQYIELLLCGEGAREEGACNSHEEGARLFFSPTLERKKRGERNFSPSFSGGTKSAGREEKERGFPLLKKREEEEVQGASSGISTVCAENTDRSFYWPLKKEERGKTREMGPAIFRI